MKVPSKKFGTIGRTYCNKIQLIETFAKYESVTSKALKL